MNRQYPRTVRWIATLSLTGMALSLAACASAEQAASGGNGPAIELDSELVVAATDKANEIAGDEELSGSIEVINENGGREGAILQAAFAPFTAATGVEIKFTGTADYNTVTSSRIAAGNPPDVATMDLGAFSAFKDEAMSLSDAVGDDELRSNFSKSVLATTSLDGTVYGVYQGFSNFMLWYNPESFDGASSTTWSDVQAWTDATAASGETPWCAPEEAGAATGVMGANIVEQLFVKKYGAELARQWGTGELPWTSPQVRDAFTLFGDSMGVDANVAGGVAGSLSDPVSSGYAGLIDEPTKCQAAIGGTWTQALVASSASTAIEPGVNLEFMKVPASDPAYSNQESYTALPMFAFTDTPETRAFMRYLASAEEQALLASADNWTVSNINVSPEVYSSELLQKAAETYFAPDVEVAMGPRALANASVVTAFWQGVVSYKSDPSSLDAVLETIEAAHNASVK